MPSSQPYGYIAPQTVDTSPLNPTAPASTSAYKMQGLAALITPSTPVANVLALISGVLTDSATTVGNGINLQLYYGPVVNGVAPPANGAAIPNNAVALGPVMEWATGVTLTTAADLFQPFCMHGVAKALTPGQQYWFDIAAESVTTASNVAVTNPHVTLVEIG
jgi:hypothetical protein